MSVKTRKRLIRALEYAEKDRLLSGLINIAGLIAIGYCFNVAVSVLRTVITWAYGLI